MLNIYTDDDSIKDLEFSSEYGDFNFEQGDFYIFNNIKTYLRNIAMFKLKTNYKDIFNQPDEGANLDSYIGKGFDNLSVSNIKEKISLVFSEDNFLKNYPIDIYHIILNTNSLYLRIVFLVNTKEFYSVSINMNETEGLVIE